MTAARICFDAAFDAGTMTMLLEPHPAGLSKGVVGVMATNAVFSIQ
jgi:hypothetical protein